MDLKNKLKGLPTIYYFNLDNIIERREYMESQFDRWEIKDFKRISSTKYLASQVKTWKHLLNGDYTKYNHLLYSSKIQIEQTYFFHLLIQYFLGILFLHL